MNLKKLTFSLLGVAIAFVLFGDHVLPAPASTYSYQSRTNIGKFLVGLVPHFKSQQPDAQTEHAVDNLKP